MLQQSRTLGLALMLMFALGASVSASAQAVELPEFTVETKATGTGGESLLILEGTQVKCANSASIFSPTSKKLGTFKIEFASCKNAGKPCISLGQTSGSGIIDAAGEWHLVPLASGDTGIWFLLAASDNAEALHLECEVAGLILVWGNVLGSLYGISKKTFKIDLEKETTTKQKLTEFENNSGTTVKAGLHGKLGAGAERIGVEESAENLITMEKETEVAQNALANVGGNLAFPVRVEVGEARKETFTFETLEANVKIEQAFLEVLKGVESFDFVAGKDACSKKAFAANKSKCTIEIEFKAKELPKCQVGEPCESQFVVPYERANKEKRKKTALLVGTVK